VKDEVTVPLPAGVRWAVGHELGLDRPATDVEMVAVWEALLARLVAEYEASASNCATCVERRVECEACATRRELSEANLDSAVWLRDGAPSCPMCGAGMVLRSRRDDGAQFWGCAKFPACRGTRPREDRP